MRSRIGGANGRCPRSGGNLGGVATPPATKQQTDDMRGFLQHWLWAPGGFAAELAPKDRRLLHETILAVSDAPTQRMLVSVGATGPDSHLLGLFNTPAPEIRIFANEILVTGYQPEDVFEHELGHRLKFDHDLRPARMPYIANAQTGRVHCAGPHDVAGHTMGAAALDLPASMAQRHINPCPVCNMHSDLADALALITGLREDAYLAAQPHELPLGLGGTIPLMRSRIACAQLDLMVAAQDALVGRTGEIHNASHLYNQAQRALAGILDPEAVTLAYPPIRIAWRATYTINHGYFVRKYHPDDRVASDRMLDAAFSPR